MAWIPSPRDGALGNIDLGAAINATHANQNGRVVIVTSGRFPEGGGQCGPSGPTGDYCQRSG